MTRSKKGVVMARHTSSSGGIQVFVSITSSKGPFGRRPVLEMHLGRIVGSLFFFLGSAQTLFPTLASLFFFLHAALFASCPVRFLFHGRPVLLKGTRHGGLITDRRVRRGSSAVGVLRAGVSPRFSRVASSLLKSQLVGLLR